MWPFKKTTRHIYKYWDGSRRRAADPIKIYRAIHNDPEFNMETHFPLLPFTEESAPERWTKEHDEAFQLALDMVGRVFGVQYLNESGKKGLTELEGIYLLEDFIFYLTDLKKNS